MVKARRSAPVAQTCAFAASMPARCRTFKNDNSISATMPRTDPTIFAFNARLAPSSACVPQPPLLSERITSFAW